MTFTTLAALRQWQQAVKDNQATGELAVLLARQVEAQENAHERGVFLSLAYQYATKRTTE